LRNGAALGSPVQGAGGARAWSLPWANAD